jgi:serine/threonine protein phosphatase 1
MRLYAVGDVHGMDDALAGMHAAIAADLAARPPADHRIVHLGDYVDRGPDPAKVIDRLAMFEAIDDRVICLAGNHDLMMRGFLADPAGLGPIWLLNGGGSTLRSYGVFAAGRSIGERELPALANRLRKALPPHHRAFLDGLRFSARAGDFFFCHAGIRPGVPLDAQSAEDLTWIREPFLLSDRDHGVVVVHGHTPVDEPEVLPNRINIDTGAVFGGRLTVLVLEGTAHWFL